MALDPTARRANLKDSIKKYFIENLKDTEALNISFDKSQVDPKLFTGTVDRWVQIPLGSLDRQDGELILRLLCCSRNDDEGYKVAQLSDKVYGYLVDETQTDGMARIPFYRSHPTDAWTLLGGIIVQDAVESDELEGPDGTKYIVITCRLRWGAKL